MKTAYCICGLGSDERIFSKLNWGTVRVQYLHWLPPLPDESFTAYAGRMSLSVTEKNATLIGVSFGGMLCIEMAKLISVNKIILISSVKTHQELPRWMKTSGKLRLDAILPKKQVQSIRPFKLIEPLENYFLGAVTEEEKQLAHQYRMHVDPVYLKWSIHQVLNWKNDWTPENLYHLHGTNDRIFPYSRVSPTHTIPSAGHFLVYQRAPEVSAILSEIL